MTETNTQDNSSEGDRPTTGLGQREAWEIALARIKTEDDLTNERMKIFLLFNGFLVTFGGFVLKDLANLATPQYVLVTVVAAIGCATAIPFLRLDVRSSRYRRTIDLWFHDDKYKDHFPPLRGSSTVLAKYKGTIGEFTWLKDYSKTSSLFGYFLVGWFFILVVVIVFSLSRK